MPADQVGKSSTLPRRVRRIVILVEDWASSLRGWPRPRQQSSAPSQENVARRRPRPPLAGSGALVHAFDGTQAPLGHRADYSAVPRNERRAGATLTITQHLERFVTEIRETLRWHEVAEVSERDGFGQLVYRTDPYGDAPPATLKVVIELLA